MNEKTLSTASPVPKSRTSRFLSMGGLATKLAGNVLTEGSKRWIKGEVPSLNELVLTTKNMSDVADKLARMRGAAMKLGQLLSMDAGTLLPPELAAVLARLQSQGVIMPKTQLINTLEDSWGSDWMDRFNYFSFDPIAAASIGQVHKARTLDDQELAIKIQYPGVAQSIDSDIDNVISLLRLSGLLPKELDIDDLVDEARRQLHLEADYHAESRHLNEFARKISNFRINNDLLMPTHFLELSETNIMAMSYLNGVGIEQWLKTHPESSSHIMGLMLELFFTELLQMHLMQTDPNPANFHVCPETGKLILFDFGAVRAFNPQFVSRYKQAIDQAVNQNRAGLEEALEVLGFFKNGTDVANKAAVIDIFTIAAEPLRSDEPYHFGKSDIAKRIHEIGMSVSKDPDAWHTPPADVLFLHRKMAGLYLMAAKHNAVVDTRSIYQQVGANPSLAL
jgi:predicted unusual protein kinase regulating ubiquinone biosynthesis (AarF/ABC1/UbiB family)